MLIYLKTDTVTRLLTATVVLLLLGHLAGKISAIYLGHDMIFGLIPLFDLTEERNIPTFYSALAMLFAVALMVVIMAARRPTGTREYIYWGLLGLVFLFLAYDELFQVHERLTGPTRETLNMASSAYFAWTIPMGLATMVIVGLFLRFVLRLPTRIRNLFFIAGALYVGGALGMELVGGMMVRDPHNLGRVLVNSLEETLEMAGIVVLIRALMLYLAQLAVALQFGVRDEAGVTGGDGR